MWEQVGAFEELKGHDDSSVVNEGESDKRSSSRLRQGPDHTGLCKQC